VQPDRLGVGEHARCDISRAPVVGHRPLGSPAPGILLGELSRYHVGVFGVEQLETLSDAPVQQPAFRGADLRVRRFAEHVVGEVVAISELVDDPAPPQLVDRAHHDVGVEVACLGEQVEGEVRPHRRREVGHLAGCRGHLVDAVAEHGHEITGWLGAAEIDSAAYCFHDVQREPTRRRLKQVRVGLKQGLPGDRLGKTRCIGSLQRVEGELGEQSGGPHPDGPVREFVDFIRAVVA
jgi:hypothetical protein